MTRRFDSLDDVLAALDAGELAKRCRVVVSWGWWDALSEGERQAYRARAEELGVRLIVDHRISRHFVEVSDDDEPPLSSERRT